MTRRQWESVYETHPDQVVVTTYTRWKRNRAFFDESDGFGMAIRDTEFALRSETDRTVDRLNEAESAWEAAGFPAKGRYFRRWCKRQTDFLKAIVLENREYEATMHFHGLDPSNDAAIEAFIDHWRRV